MEQSPTHADGRGPGAYTKRVLLRTPTTLRIGSPARRRGSRCCRSTVADALLPCHRDPYPRASAAPACRIIEAEPRPPQATRPPAVPFRLLAAAAVPCAAALPPPGREHGTRMLTAHQATTGAVVVLTRRLTGPGAPCRKPGRCGSAAGTIRPAMQRHGVMDTYVRVAPPCGREAATPASQRGPLGFSRPPSSPLHCARRSGPGPGDRTLPPWPLLAGSDPTDQCNAVRLRACSPSGRTVHGALAGRGIRTPMTMSPLSGGTKLESPQNHFYREWFASKNRSPSNCPTTSISLVLVDDV